MADNMTIALSVAEFRTLFPAFSNTTKYPDATIQIMLDTAVVYIPNHVNKYVKDTVIKQLCYLMAAHLLTINGALAAGTGDAAGGIVSSAHIDSVSVTKAVPQSKNAFQYWLNQSAYGQQLLALLKLQSAVGIYFGGTRENVFR